MPSTIEKRFNEIEIMAELIRKSKKHERSALDGRTMIVIDNELFLQWRVKVKALFLSLISDSSPYYQELLKAEKGGGFSSPLDKFDNMHSVFTALKSDFNSGYLVSFKSLVQADLFDSELEQAKELLRGGFYSASAVIAGVVLETSLRELCIHHNLDLGKLDKMNADLAKMGVYNKLQQKRITALADIRNSAAHGKPDEFSSSDVDSMIRDIESFLSNYLPH